VRVAWRFDAPHSTTMLTPRRSSSLAASTQLRCLHDDFDAALVREGRLRWFPTSWGRPRLGVQDAQWTGVARRGAARGVESSRCFLEGAGAGRR
jgi:hypothetical protein